MSLVSKYQTTLKGFDRAKEVMLLSVQKSRDVMKDHGQQSTMVWNSLGNGEVRMIKGRNMGSFDLDGSMIAWRSNR